MRSDSVSVKHMRDREYLGQYGSQLAVALCSVSAQAGSAGDRLSLQSCVEDADQVTCQQCLEVMAEEVEVALNEPAESDSVLDRASGQSLDNMAQHWGLMRMHPNETDIQLRERLKRVVLGRM